ncbi:hypothetical protein EV182_004169 [Spiromyces aspiralis]|uniref:Uncharacterized protein n=1 Tax=Spiromyces aspiralis TaxID=68401 RepID=A0ACC1HCU0_9FUNG|nr:hypothetical protein EV182_004169 [Spiromyces aspiralis]
MASNATHPVPTTPSPPENLRRPLEVLTENLAQSNYYEAHQGIRSVALRFVKKRDYGSAVELIYTGAWELATHDQWNSVADLALLLLDVYSRSHVKVEPQSKDRLYDLLQNFPPTNKAVVKVTEATVRWSISEGGNPAGDPELHHFFGSLYKMGGLYEQAERHFLFGTKQSPVAYGLMLVDWARGCEATEDYGMFAARGVLGYLVTNWFGGAVTCLSTFMKAFKERKIGVVEQREAVRGRISTAYCPGHPVLNFVNLLLQVVERSNGSPTSKASDVFRRLREQYATWFGKNEACINKMLDQIGLTYFGIQPARPVNPLADLMSGIFGSGATRNPAGLPGGAGLD